MRHLPLSGFWTNAGTQAAPSSDTRPPSLHQPQSFERACLALFAGSMVGRQPISARLRPEFSRTEQIQSDSRIKSIPFELAACRPCVVPVLNRLIRASRIAGVAQWQSNGFVNRRSSVQSRPPAPSKTLFSLGVSMRALRLESAPLLFLRFSSNRGSGGIRGPDPVILSRVRS